MKRVADQRYEEQDTSDDEDYSSQKKKKKNYTDGDVIKEYKNYINDLIPTVPDKQVHDMVKDQISVNIDMFVEMLGVGNGNYVKKLLPQDNIIKIVTNIVIEGINHPVYDMIHEMPFHYENFNSMSMIYNNSSIILNDDGTETFLEKLLATEPPSDDEVKYTVFVQRLHGIISNIIRIIASVVESDDFVRGSPMLGIFIKTLKIPTNTKRRICKHLFNQITAAFAGQSLYTFFISDENIIKETIARCIK
uniref:Uncharacterized protein n=1 Tax=Chionoecetes opilio bacilliform virus TaxID=1825681 RepID=A0A1Q3DL50_9VIRU|nr:wsv310-like protein [Chionoecetes opilio bacilliform virus]GAV93230.1 hypothetical protein SCV_110 [Chionoecetes opilio bacilliform virus]